MSMVFSLPEAATTACPNCGKENEGSNSDEIQWYVVNDGNFQNVANYYIF